MFNDMTNTGTKNFGVNDHDFQLKDSAGNTYNVSSDIGAGTYSTFKGGQQLGGQVPPGTTVRYYIAFDVTPSATGLVLHPHRHARHSRCARLAAHRQRPATVPPLLSGSLSMRILE